MRDRRSTGARVNVALVLAAGRGERLAAPGPKATVLLGGRPLVAWCLETLGGIPAVDRIVLVGDHARLAPALDSLPAKVRARIAEIVPGGSTRQESCASGLAAAGSDAGFVLVHDAARPFAEASLFEAVLRAAQEDGAALSAVPLSDTLKRVHGMRVAETLAREELWRAQTPQAFEAALFRRAHAEAVSAFFTGTDDAALVERLGLPVLVVPGSESNRKITTAEDLAWAEAFLATRGVGT